jgi:hypothetical protein
MKLAMPGKRLLRYYYFLIIQAAMAQQPIFWVVIVTAIIVTICQLLVAYNQFYTLSPQNIISNAPIVPAVTAHKNNEASSNNNNNHHHHIPDDVYPYGLTIPNTPAVALPSVRISAEEDAKVKRSFYGGAGDKPHLGGFTSFDPMGVSPTLW